MADFSEAQKSWDWSNISEPPLPICLSCYRRCETLNKTYGINTCNKCLGYNFVPEFKDCIRCGDSTYEKHLDSRNYCKICQDEEYACHDCKNLVCKSDTQRGLCVDCQLEEVACILCNTLIVKKNIYGNGLCYECSLPESSCDNCLKYVKTKDLIKFTPDVNKNYYDLCGECHGNLVKCKACEDYIGLQLKQNDGYCGCCSRHRRH